MPRKLKDCEAGKIRNPTTNRCVKENGAIGKKIKTGVVNKQDYKERRKLKDCEAGKIRNPATNRCVKENGAIGKKLKIPKPAPAKCECDDKPKGAKCECDDNKKTAASKIVLAVKAKKARKEYKERVEKTAASKIVLAIKAKKARTEFEKRKAAKKDNFILYNRKTGDDINIYSNLYEVLDLPLKSSFSEVKKKYRKLALIFHPDKYVNKSDSDRLRAEKEIKYINEAYEVLGNELNKAKYDKLLEDNTEFIKTIELSDLVRYLLQKNTILEKKIIAHKLIKLLSLFEEKENSIPTYFKLKIVDKFGKIQSMINEEDKQSEINNLIYEIEELLARY